MELFWTAIIAFSIGVTLTVIFYWIFTPEPEPDPEPKHELEKYRIKIATHLMAGLLSEPSTKYENAPKSAVMLTDMLIAEIMYTEESFNEWFQSTRESIRHNKDGLHPANIMRKPIPTRIKLSDTVEELRHQLICASLSGIRAGKYQTGSNVLNLHIWTSTMAAKQAISDADAVIKLLEEEAKEKLKRDENAGS